MLTPNPALYTNVDPICKDNTYFPGREARRNNTDIWENFDYLDFSNNLKTTLVDADRFSIADVSDEYFQTTWGNLKARLQTFFTSIFNSEKAFRKFQLSNWFTTTMSANGCNSVTFGNGYFMASRRNGNEGIMRSGDLGATWQNVTSAPIEDFTFMAFGDNTFVALGSTANTFATNTVKISTDNGDTWSSTASGINQTVLALEFGGGVFIAVTSTHIWRSTNGGVTWASVDILNNTGWASLAYGNGIFILVGNGSDILRSDDLGLTWDTVSAPAANNWRGVVYGTDFFDVSMFVAISKDGSIRIMYSVDNGLTWSNDTESPPEALEWESIAFGNNTFVAVAGDDDVSNTGIKKAFYSNLSIFNLTPVSIPIGLNPGIGGGWKDIAYGSDGVFVAVGDISGGAIRTLKKPI